MALSFSPSALRELRHQVILKERTARLVEEVELQLEDLKQYLYDGEELGAVFGTTVDFNNNPFPLVTQYKHTTAPTGDDLPGRTTIYPSYADLRAVLKQRTLNAARGKEPLLGDNMVRRWISVVNQAANQAAEHHFDAGRFNFFNPEEYREVPPEPPRMWPDEGMPF